MSEQNAVEQPQEDSASFDEKLMAKFGLNDQPEPEPQAEAVEQPEAEATEEPATDSEPTAEESEEIEFEDYRIALPKEKANKLKSAIEGYKDYTKKTQEVAEARRMVEMQQQAQQAEKMFQEAAGPEMERLSQFNAAIKQYEQVNWASLDTDTLVRTKHQLDTLEKERQKVEQSISSKRQALGQHMQGLRQQAVSEAAKYLEKHIQGWKSGNEVDQSILKYGLDLGLTENDMVNTAIARPQFIRAIAKAMELEKLQSKQVTAKRAANVPPVVKPGAVQPVPSAVQQKQAIIKQLHQAKDPVRKKALLDQAIMAKFGLKD